MLTQYNIRVKRENHSGDKLNRELFKHAEGSHPAQKAVFINLEGKIAR